MQVTSRPLAPGETDYELIGVAASITGFGLAVCWFVLHLPWPICLFHTLTGVPCITCGATRAAIACLHGEFLNALRWNPLVFITYCGISLFDVYAVAVLISRSRRLRPYFSEAEKRICRRVLIVLLLMNWVYLLGHASMFKT